MMHKRLLGTTETLARWSEVSPRSRDALYVLALVVVSTVAIVPGLTGEGTALPHMQLMGLMAGVIVAAVGLNLVAGYCGLISLGQGAMYAVGAYTFGYMSFEVGLPLWLAAPMAVSVCAVVGVILALGTARLRGPQFTMVTLVLAVLVHKIVLEWPVFGAASGYPNILQHKTGLLPDPTLFGVTLVPPLFAGEFASVLVLVLATTVVALVLYRNLSTSSWGRSLRAVGESDMLASHLGVHVFQRKVAALGLSSALGGLGGVFYALMFAHLQPESFDVFFSITILLAVILGGSGTVLGPAVGAVIVVWLERSEALDGITELQRTYLSERWFLSTPGMIGLILIVALFVLPRGVVGTTADFFASRRRDGLNPRAGASLMTEEVSTDDFLAVDARGGKPQPALQIVGVTKKFGGLTAVDSVDLQVEPGRIHGVIGPNGAGKSTLANVVSGVYRPDEGSIVLQGEEIASKRPDQITRRGLARTFQTPQLFGSSTALENVKAGFADTGQLAWWRAALKPRSQYRREAELEQMAAALLERVGLRDVAHVLAGGLAYGQARALEIARALASQPKVLILDEPAAGLNSTEVAQLGRLLTELRDDGLAMVLVEHHIDLILAVADQVTCMAQGSVIARGIASDVLADETVMTVYLGASDSSPADSTTERSQK